jgi:hypothetical protein
MLAALGQKIQFQSPNKYEAQVIKNKYEARKPPFQAQDQEIVGSQSSSHSTAASCETRKTPSAPPRVESQRPHQATEAAPLLVFSARGALGAGPTSASRCARLVSTVLKSLSTAVSDGAEGNGCGAAPRG